MANWYYPRSQIGGPQGIAAADGSQAQSGFWGNLGHAAGDVWGDIKGAAGDVWGSTGGALGDTLDRARRARQMFPVDPGGQLAGAAGEAGRFGQAGAREFDLSGRQLGRDADYLRGVARGQTSVSAEQLRQALGQNIAQQQGMAASARPGQALAAARQASQNAMQLGSGMAGQQALAGLQERQQAQQALLQALLNQRQQALQAAQIGQQGALQGYGGLEQSRASRYGATLGAPTQAESVFGGLMGLGGLAASTGLFSDRRVKTDVKSADADAEALLEGLRAYRFKYRRPEMGEGEQLGIMAQDLEKAGLKSAVMDTPAGKMVHGGKLATALAAAAAGLHQRVKKLEGR